MEERAGPAYVQCDECCKWRQLENGQTEHDGSFQCSDCNMPEEGLDDFGRWDSDGYEEDDDEDLDYDNEDGEREDDDEDEDEEWEDDKYDDDAVESSSTVTPTPTADSSSGAKRKDSTHPLAVPQVLLPPEKQ